MIVPVLCSATTLGLLRVLSYPKFQLSASEQKSLLAEILPFCETAPNPGSDPGLPPCRDGHDQAFIELTLATGAVHLVSGDRDLLDYPSYPGLFIIAPSRLKDLVGFSA
jgi:predicted nucleic acid-binding protein